MDNSYTEEPPRDIGSSKELVRSAKPITIYEKEGINAMGENQKGLRNFLINKEVFSTQSSE